MSTAPATQSTAFAERIRVVLVGTQHPGNIGSAARAMKTMGLSRLVLVAPERDPDADSYALAAGADDVLAAAVVHGTLAEAIADCRLVLGCTARSRRIALEELEPRAAGARAIGEAAAGGEIALVFGRERTGLSNDEYELCHAAVHIPANPEYSSLNLAMAVQVLSYEVRLAALATVGVAPGREEQEQPASHAEMEGFFAQLAETLDDIDFHKGRAPESAMRKLRRLFLRAQPDTREVRILRGVLADAQRMAKLAGARDS
ncbi:tRNA (cytidine32/uridine32-2'-O)-methyltransferase [Lysobacter niabensis]|jgi:tRNA (cytidine32/uridine32-2'-O)-methyltransferase|uniref:tRNA (cytidine/uridine-2'-O-)-methyltransferase TrmJ n=1 Tax=Agrilutibacter niabensis TaxID=380628 RepID=A0ABU1VPM6_9GAMM|nr:RNA methyltransferase [Lysobacter niabensis]MDR7099315.1 tRNA (cytidine32/uridine32-2'-O)-methyltransferase [Lysobacter niabensis]